MNDAIAAFFVHFVYSLAMSIRKPLPPAAQQILVSIRELFALAGGRRFRGVFPDGL
jgi:hypothetical protein